MKTRLYLDVDGVVNAQLSHFHWGNFSETAAPEGVSDVVTWAPRMLAALSVLDLDLVWATTWVDDAPSGLADLIHFGKDRPFLVPPNGDELTFPSIYWKLEALKSDQAANPSPFVWLDDEISRKEITAARELGGLALSVDQYFGITPVHLDMISEYIEEHRD